MEEPAVEAAVYWTGAAHQALLAFIREREAAFGLTHPQYCLLCALSDQDGQTVYALRRSLRGQLLGTDDVAAEAEALLERRHVRVDHEGRLWITRSGRVAREKLRARLPEITARIHEGIPDTDYEAALAVLRQIISNVSRT